MKFGELLQRAIDHGDSQLINDVLRQAGRIIEQNQPSEFKGRGDPLMVLRAELDGAKSPVTMRACGEELSRLLDVADQFATAEDVRRTSDIARELDGDDLADAPPVAH